MEGGIVRGFEVGGREDVGVEISLIIFWWFADLLRGDNNELVVVNCNGFFLSFEMVSSLKLSVEKWTHPE